MSTSDLRDRARAELLEFAWSQWVQLGVSGQRSRSDGWVMDPEALVLFTTEVARRDPRLFDEMLDWLSRNERLLSLQRLRNLTARFPIDGHLVEALVAWVGQAVPSSRWRTSKPRQGGGKQNTVPLFPPDLLSFVRDPDPVFASFGYLRPRVQPSGKSTEPDVRAPINLAFRLRLLFGPGGRAEVMRILLTTTETSLDAARIADEAGFAKRNVNDVLSALVEAAVVQARWSRNARVFVAYLDGWATLLELGPKASMPMPSFVSWVHLLPPLVEALRWLEQESESGDSEYLVSSRARDLAERIGPDLEVAGLAIAGLGTPSVRSLPGASYLPAFVQMVESLLRTIGPS
jgi:hypothetical protein